MNKSKDLAAYQWTLVSTFVCIFIVGMFLGTFLIPVKIKTVVVEKDSSPKVPAELQPPKSYPPLFSRGDFVKISTAKGNACGYVVEIMEYTNNTWGYKILFKQSTMDYWEPHLTLLHRAEWEEPKSEITAEVVIPQDFKNIQ